MLVFLYTFKKKKKKAKPQQQQKPQPQTTQISWTNDLLFLILDWPLELSLSVVYK